MNLKLVFTHDSATIEADHALNYIQLIWLKHPTSEEFREVITIAHKYASENTLTKWLCNMQEIHSLDNADQQWLVREIFTAFDPNHKHDYAYVISAMVSEVLATYHIHDLVQADPVLRDRITIEIFLQIENAQQWLFSKVKQNIST